MFPGRPSPQALPPGAEFHEWSNETNRMSPSSCHTTAQGGNAYGNEAKTKEKYPTSGCEDFERPNSTDGAKDDLAMWTRKPPFHLPPLDPSVFEKKGKCSKPGGSRGKKKTKRQGNRPTTIVSRIDPYTEKLDTNGESGFKTECNLATKTDVRDEWKETIERPNENSPSEKKHAKGKTTGVPVDRSKSPTTDHCLDYGNDNLDNQQETVARVIFHAETKARAPRHNSRLRRIASSMEVLPSKKATVQGGCSKSSFYANSRVPGNVPVNATTNRPSTSRGNENLPSCFHRSFISPENCNPAVFVGEVYRVMGVARRSSSQPDLSQSRNCQAPWRVRREGVCKETENRASMNDRMQARVMMKKFGEFTIPGRK